jgi:hypothetical protein
MSKPKPTPAPENRPFGVVPTVPVVTPEDKLNIVKKEK